MSNKIYSIVTDKILELLDKGVIPWKRPWNQTLAMNFTTKKPYRGINTFLLGLTAFSCPYWITFNQAKKLKKKINKGSKGHLVIFWKWNEKKNKETGDTDIIPCLRYYTVFNLEQTDIEIPDPAEETIDFSPIDECESVVSNMPLRPSISNDSQSAFYVPGDDSVHMPDMNTFHSNEKYYSVLFHELSHSTGHEKRLNRKGVAVHNSFKSKEYSKEELIAEMSAAFLCSHCRIDNETIENSASYIESWKRKLKDDKRILIEAAAQGQKSTDYILNTTFETKND